MPRDGQIFSQIYYLRSKTALAHSIKRSPHIMQTLFQSEVGLEALKKRRKIITSGKIINRILQQDCTWKQVIILETGKSCLGRSLKIFIWQAKGLQIILVWETWWSLVIVEYNSVPLRTIDATPCSISPHQGVKWSAAVFSPVSDSWGKVLALLGRLCVALVEYITISRGAWVVWLLPICTHGKPWSINPEGRDFLLKSWILF